MRPMITVSIALMFVVPVYATDYTITSGFYSSKTYQNWDTLLMTGGGVESLTAEDNSFLDIRSTSPLVVLSGGIWDLVLTENSKLNYSGGQLSALNMFGNATAILTGGRIDKIYGYQSASYPNYLLNPHIEMIVKDYSVSNNKIAGHWEDNSAFNIQLVNQTGRIPVIDLIEFTIIPEPATMLLLGLGGLLVRRKI